MSAGDGLSIVVLSIGLALEPLAVHAGPACIIVFECSIFLLHYLKSCIICEKISPDEFRSYAYHTIRFD